VVYSVATRDDVEQAAKFYPWVADDIRDSASLVISNVAKIHFRLIWNCLFHRKRWPKMRCVSGDEGNGEVFSDRLMICFSGCSSLVHYDRFFFRQNGGELASGSDPEARAQRSCSEPSERAERSKGPALEERETVKNKCIKMGGLALPITQESESQSFSNSEEFPTIGEEGPGSLEESYALIARAGYVWFMPSSRGGELRAPA
jgi:hypothetical protein